MGGVFRMLNLSEDQKPKVEAILNSARARMTDLRNDAALSQKEKRAKLQDDEGDARTNAARVTPGSAAEARTASQDAGSLSASRDPIRPEDAGKERYMTSQAGRLVISVMLAVEDTPTAVEWYKRALGATVLWSLGSVAGLEVGGAAFFLGEPAKNGWASPAKLGITSARVEVFCDDPDALIAH